jgi:hypothetical protein
VLFSKKLIFVIAAAFGVIVPIVLTAVNADTLCASSLSEMLYQNIKVDNPCAIDAPVKDNSIPDTPEENLVNPTTDVNGKVQDSQKIDIGTGVEINGNENFGKMTFTSIEAALVTEHIEVEDYTGLIQLSEFTAYEGNPLIRRHEEPNVIKVDDTFYLYYRAHPFGNRETAIGLAFSTDGLNWTDYGTVLKQSSNGFDSYNMVWPYVLHDEHEGKFYLYYAASNDSGSNRIMVASSDYPWGPFKKHGVVLESGQDWEYSVGTPVIAKIGKHYLLFYHAISEVDDRVRIATAYGSSPLGPFKMDPRNPLISDGPSGSFNSCETAPTFVLPYGNEGRFLLFYDGFDRCPHKGGLGASTGIADGQIDLSTGRIIGNLTQRNGVSTSGPPNPFIGPADGNTAWDKDGAHFGSALIQDDEIWYYYTGKSLDCCVQLGLAKATIMGFN